MTDYGHLARLNPEAANLLLAIDAAAPARIEHFLELLKLAVGKFEAEALDYERPVEKLLNAGKGTGTSPTGEDEP